MAFTDIFIALIAEGEMTKTQLIQNLDNIKSYNTLTLVLISDDEYAQILAIINASSLAA